MELKTIGQVSKAYDISPRMLRYYEQVGLIKSIRNEENSYRNYDEDMLTRIQQIIILRKLQIPVKQICLLFNNPEVITAIEIFQENISKLDSEIMALSTIKYLLRNFVKELEKLTDLHLDLAFLEADEVLKSTGMLSMIQKNIKEDYSAYNLNKAAEIVNRLKDVRVIYLPPMTVASAHFTAEEPDKKAWETIDNFIRQNNLLEIKPDLRIFRIDLSNAVNQNYGHEVWVSIPDDFTVLPPLTKKFFHGGQYAAYVLSDDYLPHLGLQDWINESDKYQYDYDGGLLRVAPPIEEIDSFGGVRLDPEEILNYREFYHDSRTEIQYDILYPVKQYQMIEDIPTDIPGSKDKCGYRVSMVTKNKFKIMGFTKVICSGMSAEDFEHELIEDGRLALLNQYKKGGAPILSFGSMDMDSQIRGGWRWSVCLAESDITDIEGFMRYDPYVRTIDASRWLIIEHKKGEPFDDHGTCMKLGYKWNSIISGSIYVRPDGRIGKVDPNDKEDYESIVYCWYPVKYE